MVPCCNELCTRQHPIGWDAKEARKRLSNITCKYGDKCTAKIVYIIIKIKINV